MQAIRITLWIGLMILSVGLYAQDHICPGEDIQFEFSNESYYGEAQLEFSLEGDQWEVMDWELGFPWEARVERTGFYRLGLLDTSCDTLYYSDIQFIEMGLGDPEDIEMILESSLYLSKGEIGKVKILDADRIVNLSIKSNASWEQMNEGVYELENAEEDVWIVAEGQSDKGCQIRSDTIKFEVFDRFINVSGYIFDSNQQAISGAEVKSGFGGQGVLTNEYGYFDLRNVKAFQDLAYIIVEKEGYFQGSRTFLPLENSNAIRIQMMQRQIVGNINASEGGVIESEGLRLEFEGGSFLKDGAPYDGMVQVTLQYINPEGANFSDEMPGNLIAMQDGDTVMMLSYGMFAGELLDESGGELQLIDGMDAEVEFPLSDSMLLTAPEEIDLWSFEEERGVWLNEGIAKLEEGKYKGKLPHFSFWNCDIPVPFTKIFGNVLDSMDMGVPNAKLVLESQNLGFASAITNGEGQYCGWVPANQELELSVYRFCFINPIEEQLMFQDVVGPFAVGVFEMEDIIIPNCGGTAQVCGQVLNEEGVPLEGALVELEYSGNQISNETDNMGNFCFIIPANRPYMLRASWNCFGIGCLRSVQEYSENFPPLAEDQITQDTFELPLCPVLSDEVEIVDVLNPVTGRIWMDRNLSASQVATSSTDVDAFGDLFQWGRAADGHQCRNSEITNVLSNTDTPTHGDFIVSASPFDWRSPQNPNLWQGVEGINNPCPTGYRLPTEGELNEEMLSWSSGDDQGALSSPLKLPMASYRIYLSDQGIILEENIAGCYWSSSVRDGRSLVLYFDEQNAYIDSFDRNIGLSVRCIKD